MENNRQERAFDTNLQERASDTNLQERASEANLQECKAALGSKSVETVKNADLEKSGERGEWDVYTLSHGASLFWAGDRLAPILPDSPPPGWEVTTVEGGKKLLHHRASSTILFERSNAAARLALEPEPLNDLWYRSVAKNGRTFYLNMEKRETVWDHPDQERLNAAYSALVAKTAHEKSSIVNLLPMILGYPCEGASHIREMFLLSLIHEHECLHKLQNADVKVNQPPPQFDEMVKKLVIE
jgi:hypothetical protein